MISHESALRSSIGLILVLGSILMLPLFTFAQSVEQVSVKDGSSQAVATLSVPRSGIQPSEIAVLVNDHDPQSVAVAAYYKQKRGIPDQNMIHLNFDENKIFQGFTVNNGIDPSDFANLKAQVDSQLGPNIQALVISWSKPLRLADFNYYATNYSITSAFAFGVDPDYINASSCNVMVSDPYFDSTSTRPYTDFHVRPTMMLAGTSVANVEAMIDKAVLADATFPTGDGWFVNTADAVRSGPRSPDFQTTVQTWNRSDALAMNYYDYNTNGGSSEVINTPHVLFYETGLAAPTSIATDTYVPGAVADHLTSTGGNLFNTDQMSILRWLEAGAAASYGTQTEPCAYSQKFPKASVLVKNYFLGNTVLEAYTKSVAWPTQGVFVGDPLTRPFGTKATLVSGTLTITTTVLQPGIVYGVYSAPASTGPFTQVATVSVPHYQRTAVTVPNMSASYYKLEKIGSDSTPPSAPANLVASSTSPSQVNLAWGAATDNVGVTSYQVFRGGAQIAVQTGRSYTDTNLIASTTYTYTVKAVDAAGNVSAASNSATVTTMRASGLPSGLSNRWQFDETSGTTAADAVGGLAGTLSGGAAWSTGKSNNAVSFDGITGKVTIPALTLPASNSIAFWIYPVPSSDAYGTLLSQGAGVGLWYMGGSRKVTFFYNSADHTNNTSLTENAWHHVVIVNNAGAVSFYIDGVLDGTATGGGTYVPTNIGNDPNSENFKGKIDDLQIYNRALSASDVMAIYTGSGAPPSGDTTPPVVTITAPSGTLAVGTRSAQLTVTTNENATCAWSNAANTTFASMTVFGTTGSTSHTATLTGLTDGGSYTTYVKCKDTAGNISTDVSTSYSVATPSGTGGGTALPSGLSNRWQFDETSGTTAADAIGGLVGALSGGASWAQGISNNAVSFDGITGKVTIPAITLSTSNSVSMWIYPVPSSDAYGTLLSQGAGVGLWYLGGSKKVTFYYSGTDHTNNTALTENAWHHVVVVNNAGAVSFYVDGVLDGTAVNGVAYVPTTIGNDPNSENFKGKIDDLQIYNRALSASDVAAIYTGSGSGAPPSGDTTPPVVTITAPSGTLAAGTQSISLTATTNENATCAWSNVANMAFASMTVFTTTGSTSHTATLTGLTDGGSYTTYVKCKDTAGNISAEVSASYSVASSGGGGGTGDGGGTLSVTAPATVTPGGILPVVVHDNAATVTDWIALYHVGATDNAFVAWAYLNGTQSRPAAPITSTTISLVMPTTPGDYDIRLFANDGFTRLATSNTITVGGASAAVSLATTTALRGSPVVVTVQNGPGNAHDWLALAPSGASAISYVDWKYLNGSQSVPASGMNSAVLTFTAPANPGQYEFRFLANDGFTLLATSPTLTVY